jgi:glutaredoxin
MIKIQSKNLIPIAIVLAGLLIAGALLYINQGKDKEKISGLLSSQQAAEKAINYINQNLLQPGTTTASLISVIEENGLYKFHLKIENNEYDSYVTKDGKILFTQGVDLEKTVSAPAGETQQPPVATCEDVKKSEKPLLEAFVVSQCPYGLQMQRILNEIVKNIPSLTKNIEVRYIGSIEGGKITSMHGDQEAQENLRQICIREEQSDKYWNYISCYIRKGETDNCLTEANVDKGKLNTCVSNESKGLKYAKEDFDVQNKYQVSGSPTLFLNGDLTSESGFGGRTVEAVKTLLCCGFGAKPDICSQNLTENQAAAGFSETYSTGASSGSGNTGGCE